MTNGSREFDVLIGHPADHAPHREVATIALTVTDQVLAEAGHHPAVPVHQVPLGDHTTVVAEINGVDGVDGTTATARPVVVLIHALGLSWRMWEPVIHAIAHGRRVLAYDIRGHGAAAGAPPPEHLSASPTVGRSPRRSP